MVIDPIREAANQPNAEIAPNPHCERNKIFILLRSFDLRISYGEVPVKYDSTIPSANQAQNKPDRHPAGLALFTFLQTDTNKFGQVLLYGGQLSANMPAY